MCLIDWDFLLLPHSLSGALSRVLVGCGVSRSRLTFDTTARVQHNPFVTQRYTRYGLVTRLPGDRGRRVHGRGWVVLAAWTKRARKSGPPAPPVVPSGTTGRCQRSIIADSEVNVELPHVEGR